MSGAAPSGRALLIAVSVVIALVAAALFGLGALGVWLGGKIL